MQTASNPAAHTARPIQADPVIAKLLDKVPADMRSSFSDEQLPLSRPPAQRPHVLR
jgi:hypothetical protein